MFRCIVKALTGALASAACLGASGDWSSGKQITDDGNLMRYQLDLQGGAKLYAIVSADGGVQAVHLVPRSDLGNSHWLYYTQLACRWDRSVATWGNVVIGDRMAISIPSTAWAEDEDDNGPANALDAQLLAVGSSNELLALFSADPAARSAFLPTQQMLDEETGLCALAADEGDNAAVGSVTLLAQVDGSRRAVDITRAAATLRSKASMRALSGSTASAEIMDPDGTAIGTATFEQAPSGVLMNVAVTRLEPGAHGIHLHRVGACTPDFKAASGHINPRGAKHGLRHPDGPDNGDLPLLHVSMDGSARAEFFTTLVSLSDDAMGDPPGLLDEDGSAVVIHANPDDHLTQPIGGAGGRVGCGVISATEAMAPEV